MKYFIVFILIMLSVSCSRMVVVTDRDTKLSIELHERDLLIFLLMSNRHIILIEDDTITDDDVM